MLEDMSGGLMQEWRDGEMDRPHPGPLPREREKRWPSSLQSNARSVHKRSGENFQEKRTRRSAFQTGRARPPRSLSWGRGPG